jgi:hypothetical protein
LVEHFAELPGLIARELETRRRVVMVLLDAFGWAFVQRHERHPLLARMARDGTLAPMASQFPSTTTAHITTLHTGLPVEAHGLYEWRVWEPAVEEIIIPFLVGAADAQRGIDRDALLPAGPSFYQRLGVRAGASSVVFSPARFSPSTYDGYAIRGPRLVPFDDLTSGAQQLAATVADPAADMVYAHLYWDQIDAIGHEHGPSSAQFDDACLRALDNLYGAFFGPEAPAFDDTLLILTADHGQVDVAPERVDYLSIDGALPAGSARDLFVHVAEDRVEETIEHINATLGDRGTALRSSALFPAPGPRLAARLAPICVLPAPGRMTWFNDHRGVEQVFRGHHGGRTAQEATTFLGTLELG